MRIIDTWTTENFNELSMDYMAVTIMVVRGHSHGKKIMTEQCKVHDSNLLDDDCKPPKKYDQDKCLSLQMAVGLQSKHFTSIDLQVSLAYISGI